MTCVVFKASGHFGEDGSIVGALHKGQTSLREWSGGSTSLHISVGPGNQFDAHIDKVSPVNKPVDGKTQIDPVKGKQHWENEVLPEKIRDKTGLPIKIKGSIEENKKGKYGAEVKVGVEVELRGPVDKQKKPLVPKPVAPNPAPQDVQVRIAQRVGRTKHHFPISVGTRPDEVPVAKAVATYMAAEMLQAGKNRGSSIQMDLPYYLNKQDDHDAVLDMMQEIGQIVRSELGPPADEVTRLTVTFGSNRQGGTVSLED
jgi:hypothetical protein